MKLGSLLRGPSFLMRRSDFGSRWRKANGMRLPCRRSLRKRCVCGCSFAGDVTYCRAVHALASVGTCLPWLPSPDGGSCRIVTTALVAAPAKATPANSANAAFPTQGIPSGFFAAQWNVGGKLVCWRDPFGLFGGYLSFGFVICTVRLGPSPFGFSINA
ncbi:hypothetical protein FF011L_18990 [Roseimaritima multifibrata]|uniref:Uncharacterized protein n=1 Tax=Roseimaritima multifibrata TaxID=1930274 RepID=A0A517ME32_9BACT|nr:hypothetical protein FF011L_18990 [Roseimaritima multifibrata]